MICPSGKVFPATGLLTREVEGKQCISKITVLSGLRSSDSLRTTPGRKGLLLICQARGTWLDRVSAWREGKSYGSECCKDQAPLRRCTKQKESLYAEQNGTREGHLNGRIWREGVGEREMLGLPLFLCFVCFWFWTLPQF